MRTWKPSLFPANCISSQIHLVTVLTNCLTPSSNPPNLFVIFLLQLLFYLCCFVLSSLSFFPASAHRSAQKRHAIGRANACLWAPGGQHRQNQEVCFVFSFCLSEGGPCINRDAIVEKAGARRCYPCTNTNTLTHTNTHTHTLFSHRHLYYKV